jgi:hypothetical protein
MEVRAQLVEVTEVAKLQTQDQVVQEALAGAEDTAQEVVVAQSLHQMVEQQLLVKDLRVELEGNRITIMAVVAVVVRLLAEMRALQLEAQAALAQHRT